jgi:hypothetical protein
MARPTRSPPDTSGGSRDEGFEEPGDAVASDRGQLGRRGLGVLGGRGDGKEGQGKHGQGDPPVPGRFSRLAFGPLQRAEPRQAHVARTPSPAAPRSAGSVQPCSRRDAFVHGTPPGRPTGHQAASRRLALDDHARRNPPSKPPLDTPTPSRPTKTPPVAAPQLRWYRQARPGRGKTRGTERNHSTGARHTLPVARGFMLATRWPRETKGKHDDAPHH